MGLSGDYAFLIPKIGCGGVGIVDCGHEGFVVGVGKVGRV